MEEELNQQAPWPYNRELLGGEYESVKKKHLSEIKLN